MLQHFVDYCFATFIYSDYFVDGDVAAHGYVYHVVAGVKGKVDGRTLIEHVLVDGDLGSLGLSLDADRAHGLGILAAEELIHFPDGPDVIDIAQEAQRGRETYRLAQCELGIGGFVEVTRLAYQNYVRPFV